LTEKVGANVFLSKWHGEELAKVIVNRIEEVSRQKIVKEG
jgi:two-component system chemotaxis response regulator CheV